MKLAVLFDADAFNFACAIGLIDALSEPLRNSRVVLHFVKNVEREIKGEVRNRIEELRALGAVVTHRFLPGDETGRLFTKLMEKRRKVKDGPVHEGECANVAWAKTCGDGEPLVVADRGGRSLALQHKLVALRVHEFAFECVCRELLTRDEAARCLDRWQRHQGRPDDFDFDSAFEAYLPVASVAS